MYERRFQRQQNSNQGKANVFRRKSERNQVALLTSEVKMQKANNE